MEKAAKTADGRAPFRFDNSYARLPERFYARLPPTPVKSPSLIAVNAPLARELGLDPAELASEVGVAVLSGNRIASGSDPIAAAYAGHQFGHFSPQLGDGRAILLGEILDARGVRRDVQLKGSGPTPYSRQGDGRAALGPVLREYILAEAMAALGIPTTRALAAVATGEYVWRDRPLPGAILTRIAASHIRVGTFQYFASRNDREAVRLLADYSIARHYSEVQNSENPYTAFLEAVALRQADLIARWLLVGFIHGVMNTDNMAIAGETIDYGPCAFMDAYHPAMVFSSIDRGGRYAYASQPAIAQWNLARLAETLLPLLGDSEEAATAAAQNALAAFAQRFNAEYAKGMARKLGIGALRDGDLQLGQDLLKCMADTGADFTLVFRSLALAVDEPRAEEARSHFADSVAFDAWLTRWRRRLADDPANADAREALMRGANPAFIPRNHRVEQAIAAAEAGDFAPFHRLNAVLARPFDDQPEHAEYARAPAPDEVVSQTFCGT